MTKEKKQTPRQSAESSLASKTRPEILALIREDTHNLAAFTNYFIQVVYCSEHALSPSTSPDKIAQYGLSAKRLYADILAMSISKELTSCKTAVDYLKIKYIDVIHRLIK